MEDLPRDRRLRGREGVGRLFTDGARGSAGRVAARALPNGLGYSRLAAVAGKSLGNAVKRNRLRRLLRAAFRLQRERLPAGWDFALIARPGLLEATWLDLKRDAALAAERATRAASGPRRPGPPG